MNICAHARTNTRAFKRQIEFSKYERYLDAKLRGCVSLGDDVGEEASDEFVVFVALIADPNWSGFGHERASDSSPLAFVLGRIEVGPVRVERNSVDGRIECLIALHVEI